MAGKIIAITGANGGLGRALAYRFAREGEHVVLLGRSLAKLEAVAKIAGDRALPVECDITAPDSIRAAFDRIAQVHPKIDALINCAAVYQPFLVEEASDAQIMDALLTNLGGPIYCARSAIPMLNRGGHIINVTSESIDEPFPHLTLYQATKGGLETFGLHLERELEERGIRVTSVRAGQMMGTDAPPPEFDPVAVGRYLEAAAKRGISPMERGMSRYESVTGIFRTLLDLPADVKVQTIRYQARLVD